MSPMNASNTALVRLSALDGLKPFSPLAIRAFLAVFLVYMTQDNVFSSERMGEFEAFLAAEGFPAAGLMAPISVYAQFTCGLLMGVGLLTRWAAGMMVMNFLVALAMVHLGTSFRTFLEPMAMLAMSAFLLMNGPGRLAIDNLIGAGDKSE